MLNLSLFKKKTNALFAPVTGKVIPLEQVEDKLFASKLMGEGVAFQFESNIVCSPCDGKLVLVANTLHAFGIQMNNGAEVLVHIGLDTVNLQGKGFKKLVKEGTKVKKGTPIIEIDRQFMEENKINLTMPMVITNGQDYTFHIVSCDTCVAHETMLIEFQ